MVTKVTMGTTVSYNGNHSNHGNHKNHGRGWGGLICNVTYTPQDSLPLASTITRWHSLLSNIHNDSTAQLKSVSDVFFDEVYR